MNMPKRIQDSGHSRPISPGGPGAPKRREGGSATVLFTALLAIMMILFAANSKMLAHLHRDIRLIDQQQVKRLHATPPPAANNTNSVAP